MTESPQPTGGQVVVEEGKEKSMRHWWSAPCQRATGGPVWVAGLGQQATGWGSGWHPREARAAGAVGGDEQKTEQGQFTEGCVGPSGCFPKGQGTQSAFQTCRRAEAPVRDRVGSQGGGECGKQGRRGLVLGTTLAESEVSPNSPP